MILNGSLRKFYRYADCSMSEYPFLIGGQLKTWSDKTEDHLLHIADKDTSLVHYFQVNTQTLSTTKLHPHDLAFVELI